MARPSKYKPEYNEQARKLALLGLTDAEIASHFDVSEQTLNTWKKDKEGFLESLNDGKCVADGIVADSLYEQAKGGNVTACIFWLKNRRKQSWRDKVEHKDTVGEFSPDDEFL